MLAATTETLRAAPVTGHAVSADQQCLCPHLAVVPLLVQQHLGCCHHQAPTLRAQEAGAVLQPWLRGRHLLLPIGCERLAAGRDLCWHQW